MFQLMKKFIVLLTVIMLLMGCSKEQSSYKEFIINSRWVHSTSYETTYCLECISDLEVKMYICDQDYNYISNDTICTYVRSENQLEFNPSMKIQTVTGYAYFNRALINGNTMYVYGMPVLKSHDIGIVYPSPYTGIFTLVK